MARVIENFETLADWKATSYGTGLSLESTEVELGNGAIKFSKSANGIYGGIIKDNIYVNLDDHIVDKIFFYADSGTLANIAYYEMVLYESDVDDHYVTWDDSQYMGILPSADGYSFLGGLVEGNYATIDSSTYLKIYDNLGTAVAGNAYYYKALTVAAGQHITILSRLKVDAGAAHNECSISAVNGTDDVQVVVYVNDGAITLHDGTVITTTTTSYFDIKIQLTPSGYTVWIDDTIEATGFPRHSGAVSYVMFGKQTNDANWVPQYWDYFKYIIAGAGSPPWPWGYFANQIPSHAAADPQWNLSGTNQGSVAGGVLTIDSTIADDCRYDVQRDTYGGIGASSKEIIEFVMKTDAAMNAWEGYIGITTSTTFVNLGFNGSDITVQDGGSALTLTHDTTKYSTYRLYIDNSTKTYSLFINGAKQFDSRTLGSTVGTFGLRFGNARSDVTGKKSYWKHIAWTIDPEATYSVYQFPTVAEDWNEYSLNPRWPDYTIGSPVHHEISSYGFRAVSTEAGLAITDSIVDAFIIDDEAAHNKEPIVLMEWDTKGDTIEDFETTADWKIHGDAAVFADTEHPTQGSQAMTTAKAGTDTAYSGLRKNVKTNYSTYANLAIDTEILNADTLAKISTIDLVLDSGINADTNVLGWEHRYLANVKPDAGAFPWGTRFGVDHASVAGGVLTISGAGTDSCYYYDDLNLDTDDGLYISSRMKVAVGAPHAYGFIIRSNGFDISSLVKDGLVYLFKNSWEMITSISMDTTTDYMNFEAHVDPDGQFSISIDGDIVATGLAAVVGGSDRVYFGKIGTADDANGAHWTHFYYSKLVGAYEYNAVTSGVEPDADGWSLSGTDQSAIASDTLEITNSAAAVCAYVRPSNVPSLQSEDLVLETRMKIETGNASSVLYLSTQGGGVKIVWDSDTIIKMGNYVTQYEIANDNLNYCNIKVVINQRAFSAEFYINDVFKLKTKLKDPGAFAEGEQGFTRVIFGKNDNAVDGLKSYWEYVKFEHTNKDNVVFCDHMYSTAEMALQFQPDSVSCYPQWTLNGVDHANPASPVLTISNPGVDLCNFDLDTSGTGDGAWATGGKATVEFQVGGLTVAHNDSCQFRMYYDTNYLQLKFRTTGVYDSAGTLLKAIDDMADYRHMFKIYMTNDEADLYVDGDYLTTIAANIQSVAEYSIQFGKFNADAEAGDQEWSNILWYYEGFNRSIYSNTATLQVGSNTLEFTMNDPTTEIGSIVLSSIKQIIARSTTFNGATLSAKDLSFDNLRDGANIKRYAKVHYLSNDGSRRWHGKVLQWGDLMRAINDRTGVYQASDQTIQFENVSAEFSKLHADQGTYLANSKVVMKFGYSDIPYNQFTTLFTGIVDEYDFNNYTLNVNVSDILPLYFDRLPNQQILAADWPDAPDDSIGRLPAVIAGTVDDTYGALPVVPVGFSATVAATNNKIDFREVDGGATRTATLTSRNYLSPHDLATEVGTKMSGAGARGRTYTCALNADNRKFKISHTEATPNAYLEMLHKTGTNASTCAAGLLGYNTTFDSTGSTEYESDNIAWNIFAVARHYCKNDVNAKLFIDEREITTAQFDFEYATGTIVESEQTVYHSFDDDTAWAVSATWAGGTISNSPTVFTEGASCISLDKTGAGSPYIEIYDSGLGLDMSSESKLAYDLYIPDDTTLAALAVSWRATNISLWSTYRTHGNLYSGIRLPATSLEVGWNTIEFNINFPDIVTGTPDMSAVDTIALMFETTGAAITFSGILMDNFRTYNGSEKKWTVVRTPYNTSGLSETKVNISGLTDDNTSTGTLLTNPVDFLKYMLIYVVGMSEDLIDTGKFSDASAEATSRNLIVAGAQVDDVEWDTFIEQYTKCFTMDFWINKYGRVAVDFFEPSLSDVSARDYTDVVHILSGTFKMMPNLRELVNNLKYEFAYNYFDSEWTRADTVQHEQSILQVGKEVNWPEGTLQLNWVRSATTALRLARYLLNKYSIGNPVVEIDLAMIGWEHELTDKVKISHAAGPDYYTGDGGNIQGYLSKLHRVSSIGYTLDSYKATVRLEDYSRQSQNCFFLGSNLWDASEIWYITATDDNKRKYGYLCDRATGQFSDGDDGKKLC